MSLNHVLLHFLVVSQLALKPQVRRVEFGSSSPAPCYSLPSPPPPHSLNSSCRSVALLLLPTHVRDAQGDKGREEEKGRQEEGGAHGKGRGEDWSKERQGERRGGRRGEERGGEMGRGGRRRKDWRREERRGCLKLFELAGETKRTIFLYKGMKPDA
eukprot:760740-Hanusia_phi.AAC.1